MTPTSPARTSLTRLVVAAVIAANVAFVVLATAVDYPDVLTSPAAEALALVHSRRSVVTAAFALLVAATALLAPVALGFARRSRNQRWRLPAALGVSASVVQVIGLARWLVLVPFLDPAQARDVAVFAWANRWLGAVIGESLGYLLTAAWTVALIATARREVRTPALAATGLLLALMIAAGLLVPLGVPGADQANFAGYVGWSVWLVVLAVRVNRQPS